MSTVQTMRNHSRRSILTPSSNITKKDDRNGIVDGSKPSAITTKNLARPSMHRVPPPPTAAPATKLHQPVSNNHLLAGYLAQEYLTKGTLFGEPWVPDRTEDCSRGEKRKVDLGDEEFEKQQRYIEVADILKGEATHLPGIFNPKQLARFLQIG